MISGTHSTVLQKHISSIANCNVEDYFHWLLSKPHSQKKGKLLELTLRPYPPKNEEILYYQMSQPQEAFEALLQEPLPSSPSITEEKEWYTFKKEGHFYVNFAHPTVFGGGFRSYGNVQEETLFCEFPTLSHLAFATQREPIRSCQGTPPSGDPTPFLIPNLKRHSIIHSLYGNALEQTPVKKIREQIEVLNPKKEPAVHIVGMAAVHWSGGGELYQTEHLKYLLKAAYLAFYGANRLSPEKTAVHTAPWGCGVFLNSEKTITVIQALAAQLAGIQLIFHGLNVDLEEMFSLIKEKTSALSVLEVILELQAKDPSWAPKTLFTE